MCLEKELYIRIFLFYSSYFLVDSRCDFFFFLSVTYLWLTGMFHEFFFNFGVFLCKLRINLKMWTSAVNLVLWLTPSMTACWKCWIFFLPPCHPFWSCIFFPFLHHSLPSFLTCPSSSGCGLSLGRMNSSAGELWEAEYSERLFSFIILNQSYGFKYHFLC